MPRRPEQKTSEWVATYTVECHILVKGYDKDAATRHAEKAARQAHGPRHPVVIIDVEEVPA